MDYNCETEIEGRRFHPQIMKSPIRRATPRTRFHSLHLLYYGLRSLGRNRAHISVQRVSSVGTAYNRRNANTCSEPRAPSSNGVWMKRRVRRPGERAPTRQACGMYSAVRSARGRTVDWPTRRNGRVAPGRRPKPNRWPAKSPRPPDGPCAHAPPSLNEHPPPPQLPPGNERERARRGDAVRGSDICREPPRGDRIDENRADGRTGRDLGSVGPSSKWDLLL